MKIKSTAFIFDNSVGCLPENISNTISLDPLYRDLVVLLG